MAAGIKILSMMMSLIIVSISEITPWVFSNTNASENAVMLDAACFDSVLSIPTESLLADEITESEASVSAEKTPEIFTASTEVATTIPEAVTEAVEEETVTEENHTKVEETTEAETEAPTEKETEKATQAVSSDKILISSDNMLWPVAHKSEVVEGFPRYSSGKTHHGVDIFVIGNSGNNRDGKGNSLSYGKPFRAAQSGVVVEAANNSEWNTGYGNYCIIDHGDGTQTLYAHAKSVSVSVGDTVKLGQTIGEIGDTGNATAPHLHFEVRISGERVNPLNYVSEP